jgi:glycosyltransferase involved in cell wall biosynthesis
MATGNPSISVVIPVFNSQETLMTLVRRLEAVLASLTSRWELILVNDGSRDASWEVICQLAQEYHWVRGINLRRNYGQHNALLCGIRSAGCDIIVTMDDDLQHPPEEVPKLVAKLAEGYDVVYGTPDHEQHGLWRNLASRVTKMALQSAMGAETARYVSAFRAFRTELRQAFAQYQSPFLSIDVLLTWGTGRFGVVQAHHEPRRLGRSNYTFRRLMIHALNMMTGFSVWPLQIVSLIGFAFALFGMGVLAYVVGRYLVHGGSVPGFPFLASIIALFSGAQMFAMGIIGEYLARMYYRSINMPSYFIAETVQGRSNDVQGSGISVM